MSPEFVTLLVALVEIIWIDIVLSGDNAVVIALACRALPDHQRMRGIVLGSAAAVALRILFTFIVVEIMGLPYVKLIGAFVLIGIAIKLALEGEGEEEVTPAKSIWTAVGTIVLADALMSFDNVVAIAAAAKGSLLLVAFGTLLSVPFIVFGSSLLLSLLKRFPILVWAGAALLGFVGGELAAGEPMISHLPPETAGAFDASHFEMLCGAAGAIIVVLATVPFKRKARRKG
jgi:YjbE family integral membrane protein